MRRLHSRCRRIKTDAADLDVTYTRGLERGIHLEVADRQRRVPILDPLAAGLTAYKMRTGRDEDALMFGRTSTEPFR